MAIIHQLAHSGGTLISKCLGSMKGVVLLSEINPRSTSRFNPLQQARDWYSLLSPQEVRSIADDDVRSLENAMHLIPSRAAERDCKLVIRDWSFADWMGRPFLPEPTLRCSWDSLAPGNGPCPAWMQQRCAIIRHPLDQYLGAKRLTALQGTWDESEYWNGMLQFAQYARTIPVIRYENFLLNPSGVLQELCETLNVRFDPEWEQNWRANAKFTGTIDSRQLSGIKPHYRRPVDPEVWFSLRQNDDFRVVLDLLEYPIPAPLRSFLLPRIDQCDPIERSELGTAETTPTDWDQAVVDLRRLCDEKPLDIEPQLRLCQSLMWIGSPDEAADRLMRLAIHSNHCERETEIQILWLTCEALQAANRKYETIQFRRRLAQLIPKHGENLFQLTSLLSGVGEVDEALTYCRKLLELDRHHRGAAANFLLYINYSDRYTPAEISNEHFRLGMRFSAKADRIPHYRRPADQRIRVGYLAGDFYTHPVGKLMLPILQAHNRDSFQIHVYHHVEKRDGITESTQAAVDHFELSAYASILRRVPNASLLLKYGDRFNVPLVQDRFRREFAARGVTADRLIFHPRAETLTGHLTKMKSVDLGHAHDDGIVLDRFHHSPLTDPTGLTRELESVFTLLVRSTGQEI